jgi:hypothetical protein
MSHCDLHNQHCYHPSPNFAPILKANSAKRHSDQCYYTRHNPFEGQGASHVTLVFLNKAVFTLSKSAAFGAKMSKNLRSLAKNNL